MWDSSKSWFLTFVLGYWEMCLWGDTTLSFTLATSRLASQKLRKQITNSVRFLLLCVCVKAFVVCCDVKPLCTCRLVLNYLPSHLTCVKLCFCKYFVVCCDVKPICTCWLELNSLPSHLPCVKISASVNIPMLS